MEKNYTKESKCLFVLFILFFALVKNNAQLSTDTNLVAHWPMDEGAGTMVTDVVGGNNGTMVGLDPLTAWIINGGVSFNDLDNNHIEVPHADVIDFGDVDFTISFLVRYDTTPTTTDRWIIKGTHELPGSGSRYEVFYSGGQTIRFSIDNGPADIKSRIEVPGEACVTGDWVLVVAVRDATNDLLSIYADTVLLGTEIDASGDISSGEPLRIGESTDEIETAMGGDMKDVRLYDIAMTADQVAELFNYYSTAPLQGIIAMWKFDEDTGTTAIDELENSDGTLYNIGDELRVPGLVGNCIDFGSGTASSYVEVPDNDIIDIADTISFSISVLINIDDISGIDQNVLFKGHTDNAISGHWYGIICAQNELRFAVDDANQKTELALENAHQKMNMGSWNHVVAVRDIPKDSIYIYLNGEKVASKLDETGSTESGLPLVIGNNPQHAMNFKGKIDELSIRNVALTPSEIFTWYKTYFPFPESVAHWKFDEASGTTAIDEIGSSDGTLYNISDDLRVAGLVGNCIDFGSGTDSSYIEVADNSILDFDTVTSFSISALVNIADISADADEVVVFKGNTSDDINGHWYSLVFKNNQLRFAIDDSTTKTQLEFENANTSMYMDGWNHIVGVRDIDSSMLYLYLNGVKVAEMADATGNIQSGLPLLIGNGTNHDNQFAGKIDEVQIFNVALSETLIAKLAADYGIERKPSSNSALSDLTVGDTTIEGFSPTVTEYTMELPMGTTSAPAVTGTAADDNATVNIVPAFGIPGTCIVKVTAEDGTTTIYRIIFSVVTSIDENFDYNAKVFYNSIENCLVLQNIDNITKIEIYNIVGKKLAVINNAISGRMSLNHLNLTTNCMYIVKYEFEGITGVMRFIK